MPAGRPTKLTPETQERVQQAIKSGSTRKAAAGFAGIAYSTLRQWELDFPEFSEALEKAEAECEVRNVAVIQKATQGGSLLEEVTETLKDGRTKTTRKYSGPVWQAAAWWLERRRPDDYRQQQQFNFGHVSDADLIASVAGAVAGNAAARAETADAGPNGTSEPV